MVSAVRNPAQPYVQSAPPGDDLLGHHVEPRRRNKRLQMPEQVLSAVRDNALLLELPHEQRGDFRLDEHRVPDLRGGSPEFVPCPW